MPMPRIRPRRLRHGAGPGQHHRPNDPLSGPPPTYLAWSPPDRPAAGRRLGTAVVVEARRNPPRRRV